MFREEKSYCVNIMISLMFFGKILKHDFSEGFLQKPIIDVHCVTCHEGVRPKFEGCEWERGEFLYFCGHHKKRRELAGKGRTALHIRFCSLFNICKYQLGTVLQAQRQYSMQGCILDS